jgi:hypothetical protein
MAMVKDLLWLLPVNTVSCAVPLGLSLDDHEVEPWNASNRSPPEETWREGRYGQTGTYTIEHAKHSLLRKWTQN